MASDDVLDVVLGAQEDGRALVDRLGRDVEDGHGARGGQPARLLNDVRHGVALVQQPQLKDSQGHLTQSNVSELF